MKTTYHIINDKSWVDDTWLAPYCSWIVRLDKFKNEKVRLTIEGDIASHDVTDYPIHRLLSMPLKKHPVIKSFKLKYTINQ